MIAFWIPYSSVYLPVGARVLFQKDFTVAHDLENKSILSFSG